jgi:hypothetical protein
LDTLTDGITQPGYGHLGDLSVVLVPDDARGGHWMDLDRHAAP